MKTTGCPRTWQAEAARDGRLSDIDARSFQRHAGTCVVCEQTVRALSVLHEVAARLPALASTPLERRRLRNELLRRANDVALGPARSPWLLGLAAVSMLAVVVAVCAFIRHSPVRGDGVVLPFGPRVPTFRLTTSEGAEWKTLERSPTLRLSVQRGHFELSVDKLHTGQRFLLDLPDGELEVQGTRFVVDADGTRTLAVTVSEGRVALRLRRAPSRALLAGERWTLAADPLETAGAPSVGEVGEVENSTAVSPAPGRPASVVTGLDAAPEPPVVAHHAPSERPVAANTPFTAAPNAPVSPRTPVPSGASPSARSTAGQDFAQAMSAFSAGDYGVAEWRFADFERKHIEDARVEDATFLRAVARSRRGDVAGAQAMAREFLRRYPNALRRSDAERLIEQR
jgi:hypothetical protein